MANHPSGANCKDNVCVCSHHVTNIIDDFKTERMSTNTVHQNIKTSLKGPFFVKPGLQGKFIIIFHRF